MAFVSTKSNIKVSILGFIKHLVSKKVYKAIEILLTPCCHPVITNITAECVEGTTIITVTLANSINLYGSGQGTIFLLIPLVNLYIASTTVYNDGKTIVFELPDIEVPVLEGNIELFMPTSSDGLVGVSLSSETFSVPNPCFVL